MKQKLLKLLFPKDLSQLQLMLLHFNFTEEEFGILFFATLKLLITVESIITCNNRSQ